MNMDLTGFRDSINKYVSLIDLGRKSLATDGREHKGRIAYEDGLAGAMETFQNADTTSDVGILINSELTFLNEELRFCDKADTDAQRSLTKAISSFEDALLALAAVGDSLGYKTADKTYLHDKEYRVQGMPKDALHLACIAHKTRLKNILRSPGINMTEKKLLQLRRNNLATIQRVYLIKQDIALGE